MIGSYYSFVTTMDVKDIKVICILYNILPDLRRKTEISCKYCPTINEVLDAIRRYNGYHIIVVCRTEDFSWGQISSLIDSPPLCFEKHRLINRL